ncbi:MAG: diacylglycerol/lipid kinase family protein [Desulfovibrionales bacterium]
MTAPALIILNPAAGGSRAGKKWTAAEQVFRRAGFQFDLETTRGPGDARRLSKNASENTVETVVAAGGDGTVSEVASGLLDHGSGSLSCMGILPLGRGNDVAAALHIPEEIEHAAAVVTRGTPRPVDAGTANGRYFINNVGIGLEARANRISGRLPISGPSAYLAAALATLLLPKTWDVTMQWEGGSYQGLVTLVSILNGRRVGGMFHLAPEADLSDGLLDVVFGHAASRVDMLKILCTFLRPSGKDKGNGSGVRRLRVRNLRISSQQPLPVHLDGDLLSSRSPALECAALPSALSIIAPPV